jgi:hypothetical protein
VRQKLTSGYETRLQRALREGPRPMSIRQLGATMADRFPDMRGATYGGVRQYAAGNIANPRMDLLRALADVLEVRQDWLAYGDGEMTERAEQIARAELDAAVSQSNFAEETIKAITDAAVEGFGPGGKGLGRATDLATLIMLLMRYDLLLSEGVEVGRRFGEALASLLRVFWIDPTKMEPYEFDDLWKLVTVALRRVIKYSDPPAHLWPSLSREDHDG